MTEGLVSRDISAAEPTTKRRYNSGFRRKKAEATREAYIGEALRLIALGDFRPTAAHIAAGTGLGQSGITYHFGALELMYRVLAREHWADIAGSALLHGLPLDEQKRLVWLILVGTEPPA